MRAAEGRVLALAARHGRIAYVFLSNGQPRDWALSCEGARSEAHAAIAVGRWLARIDPDVVIIEDPMSARRKSAKTRSLLLSMQRVSAATPALVALTTRVRHYPNMYDEADAFAAAFPQLKVKLPKRRRFFDTEPRDLVYFEAMALAQSAGFLPMDQMKFPLEDD